MEARDLAAPAIPHAPATAVERAFPRIRGTGSALRGAPKLSLFFLAISIIIAIFPIGWITPHNPIEISPADLLRAPELGAHVLGTDNQGRDVFSRLINGGQSSVRVAGAAVLLAAMLGTLIALTAGV